MELFLHIGTNKTASSYLQSFLALNKVFLLSKGYYVPNSKWDVDMCKSVITPGNGHKLATLLYDENENALIEYLKSIIYLAKQSNTNKIVLSNEVIIRLFSNPKILDLFLEATTKCEIEKVHILLVLRNPYQHSLSLYKHRAKSGDYVDYFSWFEEDYETLRLFKSFIQHYNNYAFNWKFRLYSKNTSKIQEIFFSDFLNVLIPPVKPMDVVNSSLTLNQIRIIQGLKFSLPGIENELYNRFSQSDTKPNENKVLTSRFFKVANHYFNNFQIELNFLSSLLDDEELLEFLSIPSSMDLSDESEIILQDYEISVIYESIIKVKKLSIYLKILQLYKVIIHIFKNRVRKTKYGGNLRY